MSSNISNALNDWLPYQLQESGNQFNCRWLYLGDENFDDPFFDETISKCKKLRQNSQMRKCESDVTLLKEWSIQMNPIPPTAIIFHTSRCGSTLLSQLLAINPANIVLSEVPFFDELLRWGFKNDTVIEATSFLKAALSFYGNKRKEKQQYVFIKTDSWHVHFYKHWRSLYPNIPFILLYRKPDTVLRSQQKKRGMQSIPGLLEPAIFGFDRETILTLSLDDYMTKVLETYYRDFLTILKKDSLAFACNYEEGMPVVYQKIIGACGLPIEKDELATVEQRSMYHGKYPNQLFSESTIKETPSKSLTEAIRLYDELENFRLNIS